MTVGLLFSCLLDTPSSIENQHPRYPNCSRNSLCMHLSSNAAETAGLLAKSIQRCAWHRFRK
jgi:hypothetical protein